MLGRVVLLVTFIGQVLFGSGAARIEDTNHLAVIVNKTSAIESLSSRDLRSIFLGAKDSWSDGTKIFAVSLPAERPETRAVLKKICGMSGSDFTRYFLMMNFQGKSVSPPRMLQSSAAIRAFVGSNPGALGVIRMHEVDSTVRILVIDGISPGARGYKLALTQ